MTMYATPDKYALERMRLYALLQHKKRVLEFKYRAACRALGICNKLKPGICKSTNNKRILAALRVLRKAIKELS